LTCVLGAIKNRIHYYKLLYIYDILLFLFDVFDVLLFDVSFCGSVETPILQKGVAGSPQEPVESPTAKLAHQIMWSPEGRRVGMVPGGFSTCFC